jgi:hypothetical protein
MQNSLVFFSAAIHTVPVEPSLILMKFSRFSRGSPAAIGYNPNGTISFMKLHPDNATLLLGHFFSTDRFVNPSRADSSCESNEKFLINANSAHDDYDSK